ncbi:hypothetical protein, partial [Frateuria defendens]|uniref:hypothetical protein n=1 Tax=Frateuria defendens TaxID=2219559 RepID=UPI0012935323
MSPQPGQGADAASLSGQGATGSSALVKVTASIGGGSQSNQSHFQQTTQQGSTVTASHDLTVVATGSGATDGSGQAADGDITL